MRTGPGFLDHPGEMAGRIRQADWSSHPLGPPEGWPGALRFVLDMALVADFPTAIYWGDPLFLFYNDAWAPIPEDRHPWALGRPAREVWPEIWDVIGPQFDQVRATGEGFSVYDQLLRMNRGGKPHETYWNYSFTPIRDNDGQVIGILNQGHETTRNVLSERAHHAEVERLRDLFEQTPAAVALLRGPDHVFELANPACRRLVGREDLVGRRLADAIPEIVDQGYLEMLDQVRATGTAISAEEQPLRLKRDGDGRVETRIVDFTFQPFGRAGDPQNGILVQALDVTTRAAAQANLKASEDRLQRALDSSEGLGTWDWDVPSGIVTCDRRFAQLYSLDPASAATGFQIHDFLPSIHPEDAPAVNAAIRRSFDQDEPYDIEYRVLRPDGSVRWVVVQGRLLRDDAGQPRRFSGVSFDITSRREAEARAHAAMEQLRAANEAQTFVHRLAERQRTLESAEAVMLEAARQLGERIGADRVGFIRIAGDEIRYGPCWTSGAMPAPDGPTRVEDLGARAVAQYRSGQTIVANEVATDPTFGETPVRAHSVSGLGIPLLRAGEWVAGLHVGSAVVRAWRSEEVALAEAVAEITWDGVDRVSAIVALRESEARFRAIANSIDQMVWSTRADGYHDYFNERWYEFTGVPRGSTDGAGWNDIFHPEDQARAMSCWAHSLATGEPYHIEYRLRHVSGVYRWVLGRAQPVRDAADRITRWFGTCTDIQDIVDAREILARSREELERAVEERTRQLLDAEAQLRQAQKMEAVGQLTGGIAHDFNNMLAVVLGGLDLLERRLARGEADVGRYVAAAREGAERAAALTSRLLAFARRSTLEPRAIDGNQMILGMIELLTRTLGEEIRVQTRLDSELLRVRADPGQLENVIVNLCVNARDAMPRGGLLTLATSNRTVDAALAARLEVEPGSYVEIAVTDTGVGMAPDVLARAFEPFFTTKQVGQGTGLGLSQVFGFVRQSGGHVAIESDVGIGTTVRISLPAQLEPATEPAAPDVAAPPVPQGTGERVLVVEDEARVRAFSCEALRELGYDVIEAEEPEAALRLLRADPSIQLLFTDVVMPGMTGPELAAIAHAERPDLRVLYTSGYAREAGQRCEPIDPADLLPKPFGVDLLARRVREAIDRGGPQQTADAAGIDLRRVRT